MLMTLLSDTFFLDEYNVDFAFVIQQVVFMRLSFICNVEDVKW